jgi:hypothetical protein
MDSLAASLPYPAAVPQPAPRAQLGLRCALWLGLGSWIGAMLFFSAVVAPAAFAVLPSPELAGRLVARSLRVLHLGGAGIGLALAALAWALGRVRTLVWLPVLLAGLCLLSHFGVSAAINELRSPAALEAGAAPSLSFAALHRLSVGLFSLILAGAVALLVLHVRADGADAASRKNPRIS